MPQLIAFPSALSTRSHNRKKFMKRCPKCSYPLSLHTTAVNNNTELTTTFLCSHCLHRWTEYKPNPRYVRVTPEAPHSHPVTRRKPFPTDEPFTGPDQQPSRQPGVLNLPKLVPDS